MRITTLGIGVDSRPVRGAKKDLDQLTASGKRTERQTNEIGTAFRRLAGPIAAFLSVREISRSTEEWTTLNNRLRLVTDTTEELLAAQDDVFAIAQRARQPLTATAELYQRVAQNQKELGLSGEGVAAVVDTINKTLAISGTSAASSSAALTQLGQAFASGTLRGEELNSVLEQAPALAQSIAEGMGVTVGQLRELGQEGVLSANNVIQALLNQGEAVDQQFAGIDDTIGKALTNAGNSFTRFIGEIDSATGASSGLAAEIISLTEYVDSGALANSILTGMAVWRETIDATSGSVSGLTNELELLSDIGEGSIDLIADAFLEMPANLKTAIQVATVEYAAYIDHLANGIQFVEDAIKAVGSDDTITQALDRAEARQEGILEARESSIQSIFNEREAILSAADAERQRREEEQAARKAARAEREKDIAALRRGAGKVDLSGSASAAKAAKEAEAATKRLLKRYESTEASLAEQAALYGQVGEAAKIRYAIESGALVGINQAQQVRLIALAGEIDENERVAEAVLKASELRREALTEEQAALEDLKDKYKEIAELVQSGDLTQEEGSQLAARFAEQWKEAADKAKESTDEMSEFSKRAAQNMQDAFADFLFDPFDEGLDGLLKSFLVTLQRIAAEDAAAKIFESIGLGTSKGSSSSGGPLSLISSFAGFFDSGGNIPGGQFGIAGENGPEIISGPASVVGTKDTAELMSSGSSVSIGNMVFPGVTNEREARRAAGAASREIINQLSAAQRFA
jgi:tape measure domain-containing protein